MQYLLSENNIYETQTKSNEIKKEEEEENQFVCSSSNSSPKLVGFKLRWERVGKCVSNWKFIQDLSYENDLLRRCLSLQRTDVTRIPLAAHVSLSLIKLNFSSAASSSHGQVSASSRSDRVNLLALVAINEIEFYPWHDDLQWCKREKDASHRLHSR
jgi:hypothetical protein